MLAVAGGAAGKAASSADDVIDITKAQVNINKGRKSQQIVENLRTKKTTKVKGKTTKGSKKAVGKGGSKTIGDIINNLPETTNGKGVTRNFESIGGFDQTLKDFDSLNPIEIKEIQKQYGLGKVGKLSDGTTVVARPGSTTGGATLEIRVSNSKVYKIRY